MTHKDIFKDSFPQDEQIGGSHYKEFHIQPYEFIAKNNAAKSANQIGCQKKKINSSNIQNEISITTN